MLKKTRPKHHKLYFLLTNYRMKLWKICIKAAIFYMKSSQRASKQKNNPLLLTKEGTKKWFELHHPLIFNGQLNSKIIYNVIHKNRYLLRRLATHLKCPSCCDTPEDQLFASSCKCRIFQLPFCHDWYSKFRKFGNCLLEHCPELNLNRRNMTQHWWLQ